MSNMKQALSMRWRSIDVYRVSQGCFRFQGVECYDAGTQVRTGLILNTEQCGESVSFYQKLFLISGNNSWIKK